MQFSVLIWTLSFLISARWWGRRKVTLPGPSIGNILTAYYTDWEFCFWRTPTRCFGKRWTGRMLSQESWGRLYLFLHCLPAMPIANPEYTEGPVRLLWRGKASKDWLTLLIFRVRGGEGGRSQFNINIINVCLARTAEHLCYLFLIFRERLSLYEGPENNCHSKWASSDILMIDINQKRSM